MTEMLPLVSVATPVHNGAAFLRECIESILGQTYPHWEYVVVDNASTDGSRGIAEEYAARDQRIRVLKTPSFLDAVGSQNFALQQISANSAYCKVVHADDWLFPECVSQMVRVAESYPSVGIVSAYRLEGEAVTLDGLPYPSTFLPGREAARWSLLGGPYVFGSPTSLLLRSDVVRSRSPFYVDQAPWTDVDVCYEILKTRDFGFVHQVLTFTRRHEHAGTAVTSPLNAALLGSLVLLQRHGPDFLTDVELRDRLNGVLRQYREFLLRSALVGQERAVWTYHTRGLASAGHPLRVRDLVGTAAAMALSRLFRPLATLTERLVGGVRRPG